MKTDTAPPGLVPPGPAPAQVAPGPDTGRRPSWPGRAFIALFRIYQAARVGRVSPCRFTPTCSQYAIEAVARHGAGRGLRLAVRRLGRCRPGGPSGYDPIPE